MSDYDYKNVASDYDDLLKQYQWQAPELFYEYLSKHVRKGTKMLDVGVGTGISSQGFVQHEVELHGLDNSPDMLAICRAKKVFKEVHLLDILNDQIPYAVSTFDYVICSGVLHFFSSLDHIFAEIGRVLKGNGLFAFTILEYLNDDLPYAMEIYQGVTLYRHGKNYIRDLTNRSLLTFHYEQTFTALKDLDTKETLDYKLMVFRKD